MRLVRLATASLCGIFLLSTSVCAQVPPSGCDPDAATLVAGLEKAGQQIVADALTDSGNFLQLMVDPDTGDFSIVVRLADGPGCLFHSGRAWVWLPGKGARR